MSLLRKEWEKNNEIKKHKIVKEFLKIIYFVIPSLFLVSPRQENISHTSGNYNDKKEVCKKKWSTREILKKHGKIENVWKRGVQGRYNLAEISVLTVHVWRQSLILTKKFEVFSCFLKCEWLLSL